MRASSRKLLLVVVGLCVLGFVAYRARGFFGDFSGAKLLHTVRGANPYLLALSLAAIYCCYALRALRWEVFQRNLGQDALGTLYPSLEPVDSSTTRSAPLSRCALLRHPSFVRAVCVDALVRICRSHFWNIYKSTLAGFAAVFLLGRAGEPIRPILLARKEKLPLSGMFGIYVLERLFDAASTAVIAAIGLVLYQSHNRGTTKATGSMLFLGVFAAVVILIYLRLHGAGLLERRLQPAIGTHGWRGKTARIVLGIVSGLQTIRTWNQLVLAVLYSAAHWFLVLLVYFWVSHSFGGALARISLSDAMLLMAFTSLGSAVQVPGVGGGSQAGSIFAYTAIFGVEREPAVVAAIVAWLITFASCSLAGVPLLIHEGWSLGELREMAKHEDEIIDKEIAGKEDVVTRRGEPAE
jgi:glycosyltransferase 2 family protein